MIFRGSRDGMLEFSTRPCKGDLREEREGRRGYRTRQCFDNSGDSLAPLFFSHPQPYNLKWCVLHSRVWCNIVHVHTSCTPYRELQMDKAQLPADTTAVPNRMVTRETRDSFTPASFSILGHAHSIVITISLSFCIFHLRFLTHNYKIHTRDIITRAEDIVYMISIICAII